MSDNPPQDFSSLPQATEAAPPNRTLRAVLIIVGIALVLCCVGGGVGGYLIYRGVDGRMGPPEEAVAAYLDDTQDGDYSRAYDRLCDELKAEFSEDTFTSKAKEDPFTSYKITKVSVREADGNVTARVDVELAQSRGGTHSTSFKLIHPGYTWQICL